MTKYLISCIAALSFTGEGHTDQTGDSLQEESVHTSHQVSCENKQKQTNKQNSLFGLFGRIKAASAAVCTCTHCQYGTMCKRPEIS